MGKKLAIFPVDRDVNQIARNRDILQGYELVALMAPRFLKYGGNDSCCLDGGNPTGFILSDYHEAVVMGCDLLYVFYNSMIKDLTVYQNVIKHALDNGKEVVVSAELDKKLNNVQLDGYSIFQNDEESFANKQCGSYLCNISVPVITILSQGELTDSFLIELAARRYFQDNGYKVSQIGSKEYSTLFGFSAIPEFLYEDMDIQKKILMFNSYVKVKERAEKPDLIIISVPDGIMKYSNTILNGMGILPFIVGNAVKNDIGIVSVYHNQYKKNYFDNLIQYCRYRLNNTARYFHISNTYAQINMEDDTKLDYGKLNQERLSETNDFEMGGDYFRLFQIFDRKSTQDILREIERELLGNVDVVK